MGIRLIYECAKKRPGKRVGLVGASVKELWERKGMVTGGCWRCCSRGLGWWKVAGCLRRRSGGNCEPWRSVSASGWSVGSVQPRRCYAVISARMTSCVPRKLMRMIMRVMSGIPRWPSERSHRRN